MYKNAMFQVPVIQRSLHLCRRLDRLLLRHPLPSGHIRPWLQTGLRLSERSTVQPRHRYIPRPQHGGKYWRGWEKIYRVCAFDVDRLGYCFILRVLGFFHARMRQESQKRGPFSRVLFFSLHSLFSANKRRCILPADWSFFLTTYTVFPPFLSRSQWWIKPLYQSLTDVSSW